MSTALIILVQLITAMATVAIAFFGYQSYKLTKEIKNASNKQHEDMKDLSLALITTSLYIAKYSHTTQKDLPRNLLKSLDRFSRNRGSCTGIKVTFLPIMTSIERK